MDYEGSLVRIKLTFYSQKLSLLLIPLFIFVLFAIFPTTVLDTFSIVASSFWSLFASSVVFE